MLNADSYSAAWSPASEMPLRSRYSRSASSQSFILITRAAVTPLEVELERAGANGLAGVQVIVRPRGRIPSQGFAPIDLGVA